MYVMGAKENGCVCTGFAQGRDSGRRAGKLCSKSQVNVENYRSILLYTDTLVKLQARNYKVLIRGSRLRIDYYTPEEMKITGQIGSLEFEC